MAKENYGIDYLNLKDAIDVADQITQPILVIHGKKRHPGSIFEQRIADGEN